LGLRLAGQWERVGGDYEFGNGEPMGEENNRALFGVATYEATDTLRFKASGFFVDADDTTISASVRGTVAPGDCSLVFKGNTLDGLTGGLTPFTTDLSKSKQNLFCGTIPDADNPGLSPFGTFASAEAVSSTMFGAGTIASAQSTATQIAERNFEVPDGFGSTYRAFRGQAGVEWDLPNNHTFRALSSWGVDKTYRINDFLYGDDGDSIFAPGLKAYPTDRASWTRDFFSEMRLASDPDRRVRYEIGMSYYDQLYESATNAQLDFQANEAVGIFGSIDIDVTEQITVSGEGRWAHDEQLLRYTGSFGPGGTLLAAGTAGAEIGELSQYSDFMPRAIIQWEPNDTTNVYFSWAQGSLNALPTRATTFNDQAPGIIDPTVFPTFTDIQRITSYEIGIKQSFDWFRYSLAAYHMMWSAQPFNNVVLLASGTTPVLTLPGDSKYWGVDFEVAASPIEGLELVGTVGWVDAELTKLGATGSVATNVLAPGCAAGSNSATCSSFTTAAHVPPALLGGVISGVGNRPRYNAEWTASMSATYTHTLMNRDWYVRGDGIYEGGRYVDNFAYNLIPGYWRANFRIGAQITDALTAEAFITNAFQNTTLQNGGTTSISFGPANVGRKTFSVLPKRRDIGFRMFLSY
jgi:hypothetical protein